MDKRASSVIILGEYSEEAHRIIVATVDGMNMRPISFYKKPEPHIIKSAVDYDFLLCSPEFFKDYKNFLTECAGKTKIFVTTEKDEIGFILPDGVSPAYIDKRIGGVIGEPLIQTIT